MSNLGFLHYRPIEHSGFALVFGRWEEIIESGERTIYPGHGKPIGVEELIRSRKKYAP
jgi:hypothetical protein